jgi:hypothetical protein
VATAGYDVGSLPLDMFLLGEEGEWLATGIKGNTDDFGTLGNEDTLIGLQAIAQLGFGEMGIELHLRGREVGDGDDGHVFLKLIV